MWPKRWANSALARGFSDLLFMSPCVLCKENEGPICQSCRQGMGQTGEQCPRCALSTVRWANLKAGCSECRRRRLGFDEAIAAGSYEGPLRDLCIHLKSVHSAWLASWGVDLLMETRGDRLRASAADLIVPVPLHWRRRLKRGYNQSQVIANGLAAKLQVPLQKVLFRTSPTPKLAQRGRGEREEIMHGVFQASSRFDLKGKTVLLVDDILTTGATCGASARALKKAGAKRVIAVVLARAEGLI